MKKDVADLPSSETKVLTDAILAWGKSKNEVNAKILWRFTKDDP
ncbi:MAG: hypothetical protein ACO21J_08990 [Anaerohalosphaeraceae bacterium]|jgi:phosphate/sulfate permease